ncbi:MAG: hypothetical protein ACXAE3_06755 [Candidatus Kariarchaeaceae archaeon]
MSKEELKDVDIPDHFKVDYLEMADGGKLRYLQYRPENPKGFVFMYPGMNTLVMSWIVILEKLSELNYAVDYVESREKYTSILPRDKQISRQRMLDDCTESLHLLGYDDRDYITIGSSLGSTTLIHNMAENKISPNHAILVGPSTHFTVPKIFPYVMPILNNFTYRLIFRGILKKSALKDYTDEDADPKQKLKYSLALDLANAVKLKFCIKAWNNNMVWDDLPRIDGEKSICYLIGASEDKLHPDTETRKVAEGITNSKFVDLKTNTAAHDQPLIDLIQTIVEGN